jgi:excisionase family DNA binding protein
MSTTNPTSTTPHSFTKPTKQDQEVAIHAYDALRAVLGELQSDNPEIEINETKERIKVPRSALYLLSEVLKALSQGKSVSVYPIAAEMTTQAAADYLNCSRPHLVKLLEEGHIPFTKIGKHRRVKFEDLHTYKQHMKARQKKLLIEMMRSDEDAGLYDT